MQKVTNDKILKLGSLAETEIGLFVAFFDQAHFSKAFRRMIGETPKEHKQL